MEIKKTMEDKSNGISLNNVYDKLHIIGPSYEIVEIDPSLKADVITNPIYAETFRQIQRLIEQGAKVNYVNLFAKEPNIMLSTYDPDDPSFWEKNFPYLGSYDGYKFLYTESTVDVETKKWVTPGNIGSSIKWTELIKKIIELLLDHYVKNEFYKSARAAYNKLSDFFDIYDPPLAVTYSSSGGYLRAAVSGDLYIRIIFIEDKLDRIPGYAYYTWGSTQELIATTKIDAKWPISIRPSGEYNYKIECDAIDPPYRSYTPGFNGNSTLYKSIISLYKNTRGYFIHEEYIDVYSVVARLLS